MNTPTGATRVAAVIGSPVRHSLSPVIYNAAFAALGMDWTYLAFDVASGGGRSAVDAMRALRLGGLSVTMPHKADVAGAVDRLMPEARALNAVNCVTWDSGELVGHNTDGAGLVASLELGEGFSVSGRSCHVVGAGGAARSVVRALAEAGAAEVVVVNRTAPKAAATAELAGAIGRVGQSSDASSADIVINATSVGMAGTPAAHELPVDVSLLHSAQTVVDLVYHPLQTPLLRAAAQVGAHTVGGLGMLVHQAALQFELWTGVAAPLDTMHTAARRAIGTQ